MWKRCAGSLTTVKSDRRRHGWAVSVFSDGSGSTSAPAWLIGAWRAPFLRGLQPAPLRLTFLRSDRPWLRVGNPAMGVAEGATAGREALQRSAVNGPLRAVLRGSGASQIFCEHQADGDEGQHDVCEQQGDNADRIGHGWRLIGDRRSTASDERGWLGVVVTAGRRDYAPRELTRPCRGGDRRPSR